MEKNMETTIVYCGQLGDNSLLTMLLVSPSQLFLRTSTRLISSLQKRRGIGHVLAMHSYLCFPKVMGAFFGVPHDKDYGILGFLLGSAKYGSYHIILKFAFLSAVNRKDRGNYWHSRSRRFFPHF